MMGLRWQWPWGLFSQSERCEMMAGGGGEMVGLLGHLSDHGGGTRWCGAWPVHSAGVEDARL